MNRAATFACKQALLAAVRDLEIAENASCRMAERAAMRRVEASIGNAAAFAEVAKTRSEILREAVS